MVPVCFALEGDMLYSAVDEKPKRSRRLKRLDNISRHPAVSVLVDRYEADWSKLWWIVAEGRAEVLDASDEAPALELLVAKYPQYQAVPPGGPVIAVQVTRWRSWSATTPQAWCDEL